MVAKDNEKTDTGETLDLSQEGIIDTRTCRSDTDAPERDTPPKQGEKDTWYTDTVVAINKQRGSPLGMTQPVPAAVTGNRADPKSAGHQEVYTSRKRDICCYVTTRDFL